LPVTFQAPSVIAKFTLENDLSAGIEKEEFPPVKIEDVAKKCAFVRDALATAGCTYSNPLWNLTTLIATFTEGGRADAHRMGNQHPGYTPQSNDELYDRKVREREQKNLGWPSCQAISASGCMACQACPHISQGKSPLHFAEHTLPAQPDQGAQAAARTRSHSPILLLSSSARPFPCTSCPRRWRAL
jgi:hypothetical protein